jgi:ribonuclease J
MESIAIAAKKNNRKVVVCGRSIKKTIEAAKENGYLKNLSNFISEDEASLIPRENLVIICTGSQGEKRSALFRIAYNSHQNIHLESGDLVVFSSKDIPGNEKSINNLKNLLIRQKVEIITCEDELVHASGHGYAEEIKKMYEWTRPYISVPIHGEPKHLLAHSKLAQSSQVPITKILENGLCLRIAPDNPRVCGSIKTGKMIVEGQKLYNSDVDFILARRRISFEGLILVSIIINNDYSLHKDIKISQNGLSSDNFINVEMDFKEKFLNKYLPLSEEKKSSDLILTDLIKKTMRELFKKNSVKKPQVNSHIIRLNKNEIL